MDSLDATIADPRCSNGYRRRVPEKTLLYQIVAEHLDSFLDRVEQLGEGRGFPRFVERELRAFLKCGILEYGFARVHCDECGQDALVAFSCKGRGFCNSCGGRRMADIAAHLVDRVLPPVPVRQWVLSLPIQLRLLLAFNPELCRRVRSIFVRAVLGWTKRRAKQQGVLDAETGAVTATQRFGSALNLKGHVFESQPLQVQIREVLDPRMLEYASDAARNLLLREKPTVTASSQQNKKQNLLQTCDGLWGTAWLAGQNDAEPWIRVDLGRPQRANALKLSHPKGAKARAVEVKVTLNSKGKPFTATMDPDPMVKTEIDFGKRVMVRSVQVEIVEKKGNGPVGFAEVELQMRDARKKRR